MNALAGDSGPLDPSTLDLIRATMNKGPKPDAISGDLSADRFDFGTFAPRLEILEIGEIDINRFRGIFKLDYDGDAAISLRTTVQGNPLELVAAKMPKFVTPDFLDVTSSLQLPLHVLISNIRLSAIIIVVYSASKGLTIVFQNNPVSSLSVNSSFDSIPGISDFIQKEIETKIQESIRNDIPEILYKMSIKESINSQQQQQQLQQQQESYANLDHASSHSTSPTIVHPASEMLDIRAFVDSTCSFQLDGPTITSSITRANLKFYNEFEGERQESSPPPLYSDLEKPDESSSVYAYNMNVVRTIRQNTAHRMSTTPKRRVISLKPTLKANGQEEQTAPSYDESQFQHAQKRINKASLHQDRPSLSKSDYIYFNGSPPLHLSYTRNAEKHRFKLYSSKPQVVIDDYDWACTTMS